MPSGRELNDNAHDMQFQETVIKWKEALADQGDDVVQALTTNPDATEEQIEAAFQVLDERQRDQSEAV
jgi:CMP-N-acetylneuraminic acid synthetase